MLDDREDSDRRPKGLAESHDTPRVFFEGRSASSESLEDCHLWFTVRGKLVFYGRFAAALEEISRVHRRGVLRGVTDSLQIVGQTGSGKTSLAKWYEQQFPRTEHEGQKRIRVLRLKTPESPTVKSLAEAMLRALGDPWAHKGTASEKTERIIHLCKMCGVELLIIDEIQHFIEGNRHVELMRVTDWLKTLIDDLGIPVVLVGLPRSIAVTRSNPQLRRRFAAPYYFAPFQFNTGEQQREFRGLLKAFGQDLKIGSVKIWAPEEAIRFFHATCGLVDYVVKLVDDAVSRGGSGADGVITREDFAAAFARVVWRDAPERLNPFNPKAQLRPLTRPGEPFEMLDDVDKYFRGAGVGKARKP